MTEKLKHFAGRLRMRGLKYTARYMGWCTPGGQFDRGKFPGDISHLTQHEVRKLMRQFERGRRLRARALRPSEILGC
jgi:hypothetical protein